MDSDLSLEFLRVVEQAAIACAHTMGQGDRHKSDQVAVEAMRQEMDTVPIDGTIVIGEGERDEAPMLYIGEKVGLAQQGQRPTARSCDEVDIAVDPLEGTNLCATGAPNAIAVLAASNKGGLLHAPDLYMEKLVVGPSSKRRRRPRRAGARQPARRSPGCLGRQRRGPGRRSCSIAPRHEKLIADIRATGARIRLIGDGDLSAGIAAAVVGQRRARGDGHRRRAGRRAHGGGDALPERRDLRAARRQQARARRALPRDGHHRLQEDLPSEGSRVRQATSSSPPPASPTAR